MPFVPINPPIMGICHGCSKHVPLNKVLLVLWPEQLVVDHTEFDEGGHAPYVRHARTDARVYCGDCMVGGA